MLPVDRLYTIVNVWREQQQEMEVAITEEDRPRKHAGVMSYYTAGHKAKYSSYSLLKLEAGNVVDIK